MAFKDLGQLFKKEKRLYLFLVVWILLGYTVFQFVSEEYWNIGMWIYLPLIGFCLVLLVVAIISRKPLNETSKKTFIIPIIIAVVFVSLFLVIAMVMIFVGIFTYIIITAIFIMLGFFNAGINVDKKISNGFMRACLFFGGTIISVLILYYVTPLLKLLVPSETYNPMGLAFPIIFVIVGLAVFGAIIALGRKTLPAWLGILFIGVAIYAIYLNYSVLSDIAEQFSPESSSNISLGLFLANLVLLIYTISGLIGEKAEVIKDKTKIFGADTILIWLIFSVACYELAKGMPTMNISTYKSIIVMVLFIPLTILMGLYGILRYRKLIKEKK